LAICRHQRRFSVTLVRPHQSAQEVYVGGGGGAVAVPGRLYPPTLSKGRARRSASAAASGVVRPAWMAAASDLMVSAASGMGGLWLGTLAAPTDWSSDASWSMPWLGSDTTAIIAALCGRKSLWSISQTVGMQGAVPDEVESSVRELAHRLATAGPGMLVGVYVPGSAVLGDFQSVASDVDILVVVQDRIPRSSIQAMARILAEVIVWPGTGVEASVVEESAARRPSPPWPYQVHVNTSTAERKTRWCAPGTGDSDLILHYAITRQAGWAVYGPPPTEVVGEVGSRLVAVQLAAELRWAINCASESYAVLNACRALRWSTEVMLCSKTAGGTWALSRGVEPALVRQALADRRTHCNRAVSPRASAFARQVAAMLEAGQAN